jgi:hypothetical protein
MNSNINLFVKFTVVLVAFFTAIVGFVLWWKDYDNRRMVRNYGVTYAELLEKYRKN